MTPHQSLTRALLDLADNGRRTPCQLDPEPFTSDDRHERGEAAEQCHPCPIRGPCEAAGADEPAHVWGAVDRTPTARKRGASTEDTPDTNQHDTKEN